MEIAARDQDHTVSQHLSIYYKCKSQYQNSSHSNYNNQQSNRPRDRHFIILNQSARVRKKGETDLKIKIQ